MPIIEGIFLTLAIKPSTKSNNKENWKTIAAKKLALFRNKNAEIKPNNRPTRETCTGLSFV